MIVSIQDAGLHIKRWVFGLFSGARPGQHLPVRLFSADGGGNGRVCAHDASCARQDYRGNNAVSGFTGIAPMIRQAGTVHAG